MPSVHPGLPHAVSRRHSGLNQPPCLPLSCLYPDRLCAVNRLSGDLVQNVYFAGVEEEYGREDDLSWGSRDETTGISGSSVRQTWQLRILDEPRHLATWAGRNGNVSKFDDALKYARMTRATLDW